MDGKQPFRARASRLAPLSLLALCALVNTAYAHQQSLSSGDYRIHGDDVEVRLRFSQADLAPLLQPRGESAGRTESVQRLTADELARSQGVLLSATLSALQVHAPPGTCTLGAESAALDGDDGLAIFGTYHCDHPIEALELHLGFIRHLPAGHTHLSLVSFDGAPATQQISQAGNEVLLVERQANLGHTMLRFFLLGIEHIFTGTDHIAFLIGLLLLGGTLRRLIGIISAFTVAHSITLALAALDIFSPSPKIIEPSIALSIVFIAVENLWALRSKGQSERAQLALRHRWLITFAFGLIHGFGFASALRELNLPRAGLVFSLVTFNLGVEAGQICIVALVFPLLSALRKRPKVIRPVALALSAAIGLLGLYWFIQRVFFS